MIKSPHNIIGIQKRLADFLSSGNGDLIPIIYDRIDPNSKRRTISKRRAFLVIYLYGINS